MRVAVLCVNWVQPALQGTLSQVFVAYQSFLLTRFASNVGRVPPAIRQGHIINIAILARIPDLTYIVGPVSVSFLTLIVQHIYVTAEGR